MAILRGLFIFSFFSSLISCSSGFDNEIPIRDSEYSLHRYRKKIEFDKNSPANPESKVYKK
jgi:hypothetical protein